MRFGTWRGVAIAFALFSAISTDRAGSARADLFCHTIPREVDAVDVNTGGPYFAPPIPYGHYAKDSILAGPLGCLSGGVGMLSSLLHGCHTCGACNGKGCNACGGTGQICGWGRGRGCGACGGNGCGFCRGLGSLRRGCGDPCGYGDPCGPGVPCVGNGCGVSLVSAQSPCPIASLQASPQSCFASGQCGDPGCLLNTRHYHRRGRGCSACGGIGCGICQGSGMPSGNICGNCRGAGCGLCGGRGLFHRGGLCNACGGRGCSLCAGLKSLPASILAKLLHKGEIEYFVGPGGPVPLTPGYVPYIVTTRSPRDFFAFPPFVDADP